MVFAGRKVTVLQIIVNRLMITNAVDREASVRSSHVVWQQLPLDDGRASEVMIYCTKSSRPSGTEP